MKNSFIVSKIMEEQDVDIIVNEFSQEGIWKKNSITIEDKPEYEYSREHLLIHKELSDAIHEKLLDSVRNDYMFYSFCIPNTITNSIVHKMIDGDFNRIFNDSCLVGDFKTVLFLNNPEEYEGGELRLFIDGQNLEFKLPKGFAVTYKTGVLGKTDRVTSGERYTISFVTNSSFKDEFVRDVYSKLSYLGTKLEHQQSVDSFEEAFEDPYHILTEVTDSILKKYGERKI